MLEEIKADSRAELTEEQVNEQAAEAAREILRGSGDEVRQVEEAEANSLALEAALADAVGIPAVAASPRKSQTKDGRTKRQHRQ